MVLMRSDRSNRVYLLLLLAVVCAYGRFYRFSYNNNKNNHDDDERLMLNGRTINNNNYYNYYNYDDIKHLPMNKTITIRRRHNINYHNDMESFLHDCSTIRAYPSHDLINVRYRICKKWIHGDIYRYNVIPAYDMSDLVTNYTYHRAYNKVTKVKPFAAHLLLLGTTTKTMYPCIYLSNYLSISPPNYLPIYLSIPSIYHIYLSFHECIYHLSIYISILSYMR